MVTLLKLDSSSSTSASRLRACQTCELSQISTIPDPYRTSLAAEPDLLCMQLVNEWYTPIMKWCHVR